MWVKFSMIRFSWRKIMRKAGSSSKRIMTAFQAINSKQLPRNKHDPLYYYYYTDLSGDSFMLNPETLITNYFRYTPKEIAQYIGLASFRSYSYYKITGDASLDLFHSPVDQDIIKQNRLLRISDGRVYFLYEEDITRRNNLWH